jgi:hypothetical protein
MISVDPLGCLCFRVLGGVSMVGRTSEGDDIAKSLGVLGFQVYSCGDIIDLAIDTFFRGIKYLI